MSWKSEYIILLIIATFINYACAIFIVNTSNAVKKRIYLSVSIIGSLSILFFFKYFNFFNNSVGDLLKLISIKFTPLELSVLLPIGISFYTFQALGYTIDVYRGKIPPERHFGIFSLYVTFFPQLVAGPIERAKSLLPQFFEKHHFDSKLAVDGLKIMLWGFFKKVVIADRLAIVVDEIYNHVELYSGFPLILATIFFAFQIYCDFSGYSDIAIGSAKIMGFKLMNNFRRPYFSKSIVDFWRRWHISLSTWFRDYLYIPLGGNRVAVPRWYLNLFIVFLIAGLWHGANWTFVIWGALNGIYMILYLMTTKIRKRLNDAVGLDHLPKVHAVLQIAFTFILVNLGWIFFRANSLSDAFYVITHLFSNLSINLGDIWLGMSLAGILISLLAILFMEFLHLLQEKRGIIQFVSYRPIWIRWLIYLTIILTIILFGLFEKPFIYFQF